MFSGKKIATIALPLLLSLIGCSKHYEHISQTPKPKTERCDCDFSYEKRNIVPKISVLEDNKEYRLEEIVFKSVSNSYKNENVMVSYYTGKGENRPVVMAFTPIGYGEEMMKNKSPYFVKQGFDVACLKPKHGFFWHEYGISFSAKIMKESLDDTRIFMDWIEENKGNTKFASVGLSFGAIEAIKLAEIDSSRVKALASSFCGGDIGDIIMNSYSLTAKRYRTARMKFEGLSKEEYHREINEVCCCIDPLTDVHKINPANTLMIYSAFDWIIPARNAQILYEAMGKPEMIKLYNVHYAIGQKKFVLEKVAEKLKKALDTGQPRKKYLNQNK